MKASFADDSAEAVTQKPKVLVVDDEVDLCEVVAFDLEMSGWETAVAYNGDEAFALVEKSQLDAVVTDIRMPGCDGMQLLERIKSRWNDKPAVFLMSAFSDISLEEALDKGADRVLSKPFDPRLLIDSLEATRVPRRQQWKSLALKRNPRIFVRKTFASFEAARQAGKFNLGRGGMFLGAGEELPPVGETIAFAISFEDCRFPSIEGYGIVRWLRSVAANAEAGIGIEFVQLKEPARESVLDWLVAHPTRKFIPRS